MKKLAEIKASLDQATKALNEAKDKVASDPSDENKALAVTAGSTHAKALDEYVKALEETQAAALERDVDTLVKEATEKARKEEKAKLYADLEKARNEGKSASAEAEELRAKIAELSNKEVDDAPDGRKKLSRAEVDALLEEQAAKILTQTQQSSQEQSKQIEELQKQLRARDLEAYKQRRIAEVGEDNLITAYITGNTEEEIEQSIAASRNHVLGLKQKWSQEAQESGNEARGKFPTPPGGSTPTGNPGAGGASVPDVANMSHEAFEAFSKTPQYKEFLDTHITLGE